MEGSVCVPSWDAWPSYPPFFQLTVTARRRHHSGEESIHEYKCSLFEHRAAPLTSYRALLRNPSPSPPCRCGLGHRPAVRASRRRVEVESKTRQWLSKATLAAKLLHRRRARGFLIGTTGVPAARAYQYIVTIEGCHFLQEEAPEAIGATRAVVAKVLAGPPSRN